jgi:hypothetical protein
MMGLSPTDIEKPDQCTKIKYELKTPGDSIFFPLSGRYTGDGHLQDITLEFLLNGNSYHNVEGQCSDYCITGALMEDGTINLFWHFQTKKDNAGEFNPHAKEGESNGSSSRVKLPAIGSEGAASVAQTSSYLLTCNNVNLSKDDEIPPPLSARQFTATLHGILKLKPKGTHTCLGSWALSKKHLEKGWCSNYQFSIVAHNAIDDAKVMLERIKASGLEMDDDRQIKNLTIEDGISHLTFAHSTFPIDSTNYKGSFKLRMGPNRTCTRIAHQNALKIVRNSGGSYNVYGKGINNFGMFDLMGTLILQGNSIGRINLYMTYPPALAGFMQLHYSSP